jgi:hypothetical protein
VLAAVRAAKLPGVERLFYLVQGEAIEPNAPRYIGLSVQGIERASLLRVQRSLDATSRKRLSRAAWLSSIFSSPWFGTVSVARELSFGATIQNRNQHCALTLRAELKSLNPRP